MARGLVKELFKRGAKRICLYSRGEYAQAVMRQEFSDDPRLRWFIGCVRDKERLRRAMDGIDTVIAAAALKRIETAHYNPDELLKTNVIGTMNTVEAAKDSGVRKVVLVSTDKASSPISAYGLSKALAECLVLAANNTVGSGGTKFSVCRFGNVWGSTGSIGPRWKALIASGVDVVPVTLPECTRFFMRQDEAARLVIDTAQTDAHGEIAIPELPAYRVADLAEAMGVRIDVRGLPEFEKLHEEMSRQHQSDKARRMTVDELRIQVGALS